MSKQIEVGGVDGHSVSFEWKCLLQDSPSFVLQDQFQLLDELKISFPPQLQWARPILCNSTNWSVVESVPALLTPRIRMAVATTVEATATAAVATQQQAKLCPQHHSNSRLTPISWLVTMFMATWAMYWLHPIGSIRTTPHYYHHHLPSVLASHNLELLYIAQNKWDNRSTKQDKLFFFLAPSHGIDIDNCVVFSPLKWGIENRLCTLLISNF